MKNIENENVYNAAKVKLSYVLEKQPLERITIESASDILEALFHIWDWTRI